MEEEFEVLARLQRRLATSEGVAVGVGDDTAVLDEPFDLFTTDLAVELVHFRRDWCSAQDVGWRTVVASLSDVAAMGGRAGPYVVGAALHGDEESAFVDGIVEGMRAAVETHGGEHPDPVGGDLTSSPDEAFLAVAMLGRSPAEGAVLRSGAEVGDRLVLVGRPGRAAAGLAALEGDESAEQWERLVEAYRRPTAQLRAGRWLADDGAARAMIDVSDGLLRDLGHVAEASGVGARIEAESLPVDDELEAFADATEADVRHLTLGGGEDFSLLAAVPEERADDLVAASTDWPVAEIGAIVPADEGVAAIDADGNRIAIDDEGWQHFSDRE